jgi:hypothetical protein
LVVDERGREEMEGKIGVGHKEKKTKEVEHSLLKGRILSEKIFKCGGLFHHCVYNYITIILRQRSTLLDILS